MNVFKKEKKRSVPTLKQTKRKNGIVDNIRSLKQDMKRRRTEHNVNEETRKNVSKSDVLPRTKEKQYTFSFI
jgi:hypothetical protein